MQLEGLYRGPLRDTVIQRWRDPVDGTLCYLFIPITAPHSAPVESGYVQYGPNIIGSISCVPPTAKPVVGGKGASAEAPAQPPPARSAVKPPSKPSQPPARPRPAASPDKPLTPPPTGVLPEPGAPNAE